ncbi:MAG: hypothetical protein JWN04_1151 [Myxococcaceae bacterium]|nr:hypothetical protein [Myxococcaceae bacterium]
MVSINTGMHIGPQGANALPSKYLPDLQKALSILANGMRLDAECNASFTRLSGRRPFHAWFDDPDVWINYDPNDRGDDWGWTIASHPKDVVITQYALRMGRWSIAATIVHELAHLNGAPGSRSKAAELRVKQCHMKSRLGPYDPGVEG